MDIRVISVPFDSTLEEFNFGVDAAAKAVIEEADEIILVTDDPTWLRLALVGLLLGIGPDEMLEKGPTPAMAATLAFVDRKFRLVNSNEYEFDMD
jgi:hypothetical protein